MNTIRRSSHIAISMGLLLSAALLLSACGGCPWTSHSDITVTPEASCLEIAIANSSGDAPSTGCVDPVIYGTNACTTTLVLPAEYASDLQAVEVAPGQSFVYEVDLGHCEEVGDRFDAAIPATLDGSEITLSFSLYAP